MHLVRAINDRNWPTVFGYGLFVGMMSIGYYYNVTFIQLGLVNLGLRQIGMSRQDIAGMMGLLAVLTCLVALAAAVVMGRRGWGTSFLIKLRLAFAVVAAQTVLTLAAPAIERQDVLLVWIVATSAALGVGVPATFSLTVDLIPVRDRGYVAAAVTALAYFAAAVFSADWRIETLSRQLVPLMLAGTVLTGLLASGRLSFVESLAAQHRQPHFARGRFAGRESAATRQAPWRLIGFLVLMFGVFFVDSLGFLRIVDTPYYVESAWQSADPARRIFVGQTHVIAALIAGILYSALSERALFYWIFVIFALTHFSVASPAGRLTGSELPLAFPMFYAIAVSLYTVVNFALWADFSTPRTIGMRVALGVALCGWAATFLSTALALHWQTGGMPVDEHLRNVEALALLFLLGMLAFSLFPWPQRRRGAAAEKERTPE